VKKDLVVLAPDITVKVTLDCLLNRNRDFEIRKISWETFVHPLRDPGVYSGSDSFLRSYITDYHYALILMDKESSGQEAKPYDSLIEEMKKKMERNGWSDRVGVIVFEPELEIWAWINSPHLARALGWPDYTTLKNTLVDNGLWDHYRPKPGRPKEAFEFALKTKRIPRSSSIYREIAIAVDFNMCREPSFQALKNMLNQWFPK
jgi:hypothetical protein